MPTGLILPIPCNRVARISMLVDFELAAVVVAVRSCARLTRVGSSIRRKHYQREPLVVPWQTTCQFFDH